MGGKGGGKGGDRKPIGTKRKATILLKKNIPDVGGLQRKGSATKLKGGELQGNQKGEEHSAAAGHEQGGEARGTNEKKTRKTVEGPNSKKEGG